MKNNDLLFALGQVEFELQTTILHLKELKAQKNILLTEIEKNRLEDENNLHTEPNISRVAAGSK